MRDAMRLTRFFKWMVRNYPAPKPVKDLYFVTKGITGRPKARGLYDVSTREIAVLIRRSKRVWPTPMMVLAHEYAHHLQQFGLWPSRRWTPKTMVFRHRDTGARVYKRVPRKEQWAFVFAWKAVREYRLARRAR